MAIELAGTATGASDRILGLRCRKLRHPRADRPQLRLCGVLRAARGGVRPRAGRRSLVGPDAIAARPAGIWRYLELLPVDAAPDRGLRVGSTPLVRADRLGASIGVDGLLIKDDTRNPTLSFKDRAVAIAAARLPTLRPRGPGLREHRQPGRRHRGRRRRHRRPRLRVRARGPRAGEDRARARLRRDGRADRRHLRRRQPRCASRSPTSCRGASSTSTCARSTRRAARPWATRSPRTSAGACPTSSWRRSRRARWSPGSRGPSRSWSSSAGSPPRPCASWAGRRRAARRSRPRSPPAARTSSRSGRRTRSCARSRSATRPTGATRSSSRGRRSGSIEAIADEDTADAIRRTATLEGIYTETAGGVTIAAAEAARRRGVIRDGDEVVALLTGQRAQDAGRGPLRHRRPARRARAARAHARDPGPVQRVRSLAVGMSQVRIPPVLRTSAGGQKLIEVDGATVGEALDALVAAYPDLRSAPAGRDRRRSTAS